MKKENYINLSQIGLYNPQRLNDNVAEKLFIVRKSVLDFLMKKIDAEKPSSIPQHYLIIAQRGMGKTTLLKRIEVELKKKKYNQQFIPLLFPEEQYNLKNLTELWLNALDAIADALENENNSTLVLEIDTEVKKLSKIPHEETAARDTFNYFKKIAKKIGRRPVMLIDNMSLVFDRLKKDDQHTLRAWMMQNDAPIIIGASAVSIEDTSDYGAPFYDAFQIHYLNKLSFEELLVLLNNLAALTNSKDSFPDLHEEIAKLRTLHYLTGGNPRTATMLFKIIIKGFSEDINDDLEALLDEVTPLYKARFEELSTQMQVIVDAIALHWDPMTIEQLREETQYDNGQLSPQLKRLLEMGWIEKISAYQTKGSAYQISERFFNIWFLMRRSSRRQKKELYCLSKFLETLYTSEKWIAPNEFYKFNSMTSENKSENVKLNLDNNSQLNEPNISYITLSRNKDRIRNEQVASVLFLRDKQNKIEEAEKLFSKMQKNPEQDDSFWLNKTIFELYHKNEGIATDYLLKSLMFIKNGFNQNTQDDWLRFGTIVSKLNYLPWLLKILQENGIDIILSPYYTALKAMHEKNAEAYLNSRAVEIRDIARKLMNIMKNY